MTEPKVVVKRERYATIVERPGSRYIIGRGAGAGGTSATVSFTQTDVVLGRQSAGAGTGEEIPCTSFGRSMIAAANAAAALVILGTAAIYSPIAHSHAFSTITGTPTTIAGYGITDAYTKTASDARFAPIAVPWGSVSSTPTTIAGYGITDPIVLTSGSYANPAWITSLAWSKISGVPSFAYYALQSLTAGSVVFAGAGDTLAQDNANFFWDATNHRLGVGTTTPAYPIAAQGNVGGNAAITIGVRNLHTNGRAVFFAANDTNKGVGFEACGSLLTGLGLNDSAVFFGSDTRQFVFMADGNVGTGGTSPIIFRLGGWTAANDRIGFFVNGHTTIGSVIDDGTNMLQVAGQGYFSSFLGVGISPTQEIHVVSTSAADPRGIMSAQYTDDALGARMHFRKARGTPATPTTVVTGDVLGRLRFGGYDGSSYLQMASIDVVSTGTIASTRVPTYMTFSVATDAAPSVLTERMRIFSDGSIGFASGTATPQTPLGSFSFTKEGSKTGQVTYDAYSTTGGSFSFQFRLARGTIAAPTAVQSGDNLGSFGWAGFDGTIFPATAFLQANTEETFNGSSARGTRIGFNVQAPAGGTRAERLRLCGAGRLIGGTSIVDDGISWHQVVGGTATVSQPLFTGTQTWNAGGITFSADVINITDTASAAASLLIDRQVGGVSKFSVTKAGLASASVFALPASSSSAVGLITQNGSSFIHSYSPANVTNVFVGSGAGNFTLTGDYCAAVGVGALASLTSGTFNVAFGRFALNSATTGTGNVAIGSGALQSQTTGGSNVALGTGALGSYTGSNTVGVGNASLAALTTGAQVTAIGSSCLNNLTTGSYTTALGYGALSTVSTANFNTAMGRLALNAATGGSGTAVGAQALQATTTGADNTAIGVGAGGTNTTGAQNVLIGSGSDVASAALSNAIAIGYNAVVDASNKVVIGNSSVTLITNTSAQFYGATLRTAQTTVAGLPSASTAGKGATAFVTDANATFILGLGLTVVGGGANNVPVYSDGTNWIVG